VEAKKVLDVIEMIVAVKGATEAELVGGRLDGLDEIGGTPLEFSIHCRRRGKAELGGCARSQGEAQRRMRLVCRIGVDRRKIPALLLPSAEKREHALIPERKRCQQ
jgi:hypothetical protein